ncbi:protein AMN1 homolog [Thrips palmi]|uniref:Protein AMN1 homolog n=1 Tax=Thrips palmi TaxID=161013 RepID=A0A6P8ZYN2_THRPL|nr:protein AMN1 homolog [Thrips palmi]
MNIYAELWRSVPISSLFSLSLEALAECLDPHVELLHILPRSLKTKLLTIACKRGTLTTPSIESLLHSELRTLNLSECNVTDGMLKAIQVCSQLRKLDLNPGRNQDRNLSRDALLSLWPSLPVLKILYLRRCPGVTDDVIKAIAESCPNLTELDVGGCHAITDAAPVALTRTLTHLTSLNLSGTQVGDEGLLELVQGNCGKSLTELNINHCMKVTDFSIQCIAQNCRNMSILVFQGCPISADSHYALENIYAEAKVRQLAWTVY